MTEKKQSTSLVARTGERYGVDADKLLVTLKNTAFKVKGEEVSNEQMMALLAVCERYDLNPFVNEIYAYPSRQKGIVPIVSVDGWTKVMLRQKDYEGHNFEESEETITLPGAKEAPKWMEIIIYVKGRRSPLKIREYLDEVYRPPATTNDGKTFDGPWQTHTRRMLRHKTLIQGVRQAFGLSGIYDQDEGERIIEAQEAEFTEVAQIEDVEGKFAEIVKQRGFDNEQELIALDKYLDETAGVSNMDKLELMNNLVIGFTADKKEIDRFFESFEAWKEKNPVETEVVGAEFTPPVKPGDTWDKHNENITKEQIVSEIEEMIGAIEDDKVIQGILTEHKLKRDNIAAANIEELEAIKGKLNRAIDKQMSMFDK